MTFSLKIERLLERVGLLRFVRKRMKQLKRFTAAAAAASALMAGTSDAADISWQLPNESPDSAGLSTDGLLIEAVNLVSDDTIAGGTTTVSGIDFVDTNLFGNGYAALASGVDTGDADINALYQSFGYAGDPVVGEVSVSGLSIGENYLVQVLYGDDRDCCNTRDVAAGTLAVNGTQTTPVSVSGGVLFTGSFTADSTSQTFFAQLSNGATGFEMSAYQVRQTGIVPPDSVLTLTANTVSGDLAISNGTADPVEFDSYQITSALGSLDPNGWESLADRSIPLAGFPQGTGLGDGWESGDSVNAGELVEWYLDDEGNESSLAVDASIDLGPGYNELLDERDLQFVYRQTDGSILTGLVAYDLMAPTGVAGDFNGDNVVNLADYTVWRDNLGGNSALPNDDDLGTPISTAHYDLWKQNFGQSAGSAALVGAQAVPEPTSVVLLLGACLGSITLLRNGRREPVDSRHLIETSEALRSCLKSVAICCVAWAVMGRTAQAAFTLDREYLLGEGVSLGTPVGDASENGAPGDVVGSNASATGGAVPPNFDAFDSAGAPGGLGTYVILEQLGNPIYVDVSSGTFARPGTSAGDTGVQFNGANSQYLTGLRFGLPETSVSSSANGSDPPTGSIDYSGISNRGFQFWARPSSSGSGSVQSLVADTLQHGVRINEANNWVMQYGGAEVESIQSVQFDDWSHVMVVRPFGANGGSRMYVNGVVVAVAGGGYDGTDDTPLILGANSGDMPGTTDFYTGVLDNLEMFVLGTSSDTAASYGTFDLATDNAFITDALAGMTQGDLTNDGIVNDADVNIFASNWLTSYNPIAGSEFVGGDLNSRDLGDFNLDGVVNLSDAFILNKALGAAGAGSLNFALLGGDATNVPEPVSMVPACFAAVALLAIRRQSVA